MSPTDEAKFAPRGGESGFDEVIEALRPFGDVGANDRPLLKREIERTAIHFNRLNSVEYRPPTREEVINQLDAVRAAASQLCAALRRENLHSVSLDWLTGGALWSEQVDLTTVATAFRYRPKTKGDDDATDRFWEGPRDLMANENFVGKFHKAFAPQLEEFRRRAKGELDRVGKERAEAVGRMLNAATKLDLAEARDRSFLVKPAFDRRKDLIEPLVTQITAMSGIATMAQKEFAKHWPESAGGDRSALAIEPPQSSLAKGCWCLVTGFYGRGGYDKIKSTPPGQIRPSLRSNRRQGGFFGALVKAMAGYATGEALKTDSAKFDHAVKDAVRWGHRVVKRYQDRGDNYFDATAHFDDI